MSVAHVAAGDLKNDRIAMTGQKLGKWTMFLQVLSLLASVTALSASPDVVSSNLERTVRLLNTTKSYKNCTFSAGPVRKSKFGVRGAEAEVAVSELKLSFRRDAKPIEVSLTMVGEPESILSRVNPYKDGSEFQEVIFVRVLESNHQEMPDRLVIRQDRTGITFIRFDSAESYLDGKGPSYKRSNWCFEE